MQPIPVGRRYHQTRYIYWKIEQDFAYIRAKYNLVYKTDLSDGPGLILTP